MVKRKAAQAASAVSSIEAGAFRRRRFIAAAIVLAVGVGAFWQADRWLDVHVKKIQIEGELTASEREAVTEAIAGALQDTGAAGLHSLSLSQVQDAVSGLSWADRVSARRRWPETLVIRLVRHSVVARWGGGGFVATNGEVIELAGDDTNASLPLLNTQRASSARAMEVFSLLNGTFDRAGLHLAQLQESQLGEWTAVLDSGVQVVLGRDDLAARAQRYLVVHEQALRNSAQKVASVDARYHNGLAVRWQAESAHTSNTKLPGAQN